MTENLKFTYQNWNLQFCELMSEENTLNFYRTTYEDDIPKKVLDKELINLDTWVKYAHSNRLLYKVTAFIATNEQPYASVTFNEGNIIVEFLDEHLRKYMQYQFRELKTNEVFLDNLMYWLFPKGEPAYKEYYGSKLVDQDNYTEAIEYRFLPEGKLTVISQTQENGDWYREIKEAAHPINVSNNWESYPFVGKYENIVKLKRWEEGDFLKIPAMNY